MNIDFTIIDLRAELAWAKEDYAALVKRIHQPMPCGHPRRYDDSFGSGGGDGCWLCKLGKVTTELCVAREQIDRLESEVTDARGQPCAVTRPIGDYKLMVDHEYHKEACKRVRLETIEECAVKADVWSTTSIPAIQAPG